MKTERERKLEAAMQFYARHKTWNAEPYEVAPAIIDAGRNAREALADEGADDDDDWMGPTRMPEAQSVNTTTADKLADEGSGGGDEPEPACALCGDTGWMPPASGEEARPCPDGCTVPTPPQQRDALEAALKDKGYCFAELFRGEFAVDDAPVLVPILVRALAQSGEGRAPEGYRPLTRDEALLELWQAINHPWGKTTDDKVILQRLHESGIVLAAPEPGPEKE